MTSVVIIAFLIGSLFSAFAVHRTAKGNRKSEDQPNRTTEAPTSNEMKWHVVHIRDDMGALCVLLGITNGLLAAVVALLIFR